MGADRGVQMSIAILAIQDPRRPVFSDILLNWLRRLPDIEVHPQGLFDKLPDLNLFDLCVFWLLDPCDDRADVWARSTEIADLCITQDLPIFQDPSNLPNTRKSTFAQIIGESGLGLRVAAVQSITDIDLFCGNAHRMTYPYFIRDDDRYGSEMRKLHDLHETRAARGLLHELRKPIAVEYIETAVEDLYYKYRYAVVDGVGTPLHLQISSEWITSGNARSTTPAAMAAEQAFVTSKQRNPVLDATAALLGLDFCAFDYAYDRDGQLVVWEANAAPTLHHIRRYMVNPAGGPPFDLDFRNQATARVLHNLIHAYRQRARSR